MIAAVCLEKMMDFSGYMYKQHLQKKCDNEFELGKAGFTDLYLINYLEAR